MESISVIIPYYNSFDKRRLDLAIESLLSQQDINIEIVASNFYQVKKIKNVSETNLLSQSERRPKITAGKVINSAIRVAEGKYAYISDADIIFKSTSFLSELIQVYKKSKGNALKRPPMRRLLLEDFDDFYNLTSRTDLNSVIKEFDYSQNYIVKPMGTNRQIRVFPKFENGRQKIFIASEKDFQEYLATEENKGCEPKFFNQERHCGATFAPTDAFIKVGGYCESFTSWGCRDADVQWKLESIIGMDLIPNISSFEVIHLDHPKGYFDKEDWNENRKLQTTRRNQGYEFCINQDKLVYSGVQNGS